jgi:hypothetical protein
MHPAYEGEIPEGWQGGAPVTKFWNGNFIHLYRVTRACANCAAEISLDVTKNALDGSKKNAGLLLRNCPKCRAERKAGGPGSRGGNSRPTTRSEPTTGTSDELESLRTANATMKEELEGLYAQNKELRQRLASYEPVAQPTTAPKATAKPVRTYTLPPEPLTMVEAQKRYKIEAELRQQFLAKNNSKMPWEGG